MLEATPLEQILRSENQAFVARDAVTLRQNEEIKVCKCNIYFLSQTRKGHQLMASWKLTN
jgi:hypothetical protein